MISQERLLELFRYEPETGNLYWRVSPSQSTKAGQLVNTFCRGYIVVSIKGKVYKAHRVIWCMVYGYWPEITDHINSIRHDNRLINLREVSASDNCKNRIGLKVSKETVDFILSSPLSARQAALKVGISPRYPSAIRKGEYRA